MRVLVAALLLTASLAGCFAGDPADAFASARSLLPAALEAARRWDADARLASAFTVEVRDAERLVEVREELGGAYEDLLVGSDPVPADGLARAWLYRFASEARPNETHSVVVEAGDRSVQVLGAIDLRQPSMRAFTVADPEEEEEGSGESFFFQPLADPDGWSLDSDGAGAILRDNGSAFVEAAHAKGAVVSTWLGTFRTHPAPYWNFLAEVPGTDEESLAAVDATTGAAADTIKEYLAFARYEISVGTAYGWNVTDATPQVTWGFAVIDGGMDWLALHALYVPAERHRPVTVTVRSPGGNETEWTPGTDPEASLLVLDAPEEGDWTFRARLGPHDPAQLAVLPWQEIHVALCESLGGNATAEHVDACAAAGFLTGGGHPNQA